MKKGRKIGMLLLMILTLSFVFIPKNVEAASSKTMKKAYKKYLKEEIGGKEYYSIVNIGNGNRPALLIAKGNSTYKDNPEYGSKNHYYACHVYYYVKGKVKKVGTFDDGGRVLSLAKKKGQNYIQNGMSDAAFLAYVKSNKFYKYEFYEEYGSSKLTAGGKTIKEYGCLTSSEFDEKKDAYQYGEEIKFQKNSYGYVAPNIEYKENKHTYKNNTYFTGYLEDDVYPNVYKQSKKTKRITQIQQDAYILKAKGQYILTQRNQGDFSPSEISVINAKNGKVKTISEKAGENAYRTAIISGSYVYYPEYSEYEIDSRIFKMKRYKLSSGKKETLTKEIDCDGIIKYTNKYISYLKGSSQYKYYYSTGKIEKK